MIQPKFTKEDKSLLYETTIRQKVKLSSGTYYVNSFKRSRYYYEVIAYELAQIFGLFALEYHLVELGNDPDNLCYAVVSKDLNSYGKFTEIAPMAVKDYQEGVGNDKRDKSLCFLWNLLEKRYGLSTANMIEFVKMYIFDLLFLNNDRHFYNFGLLESANRRNLVLYDNEYIFDQGSANLVVGSGYATKFGDSSLDLANFLKESSVEFIDLFLYYYDLITTPYLEKLLGEIEQKYSISIPRKDYILYYYDYNRKKLQKSMDKLWGPVLFRPLHEIDKQRIAKAGLLGTAQKISIGFREYYVKQRSDIETGHELIGSALAEILNIPTPKTRIININRKWYILSEEIPELQTCENLFEVNNLQDIWNELETLGMKKMTEVIRIYLFDILFLNSDRSARNYGFAKNKNGQEQLFAIDHELIFDYDVKPVITESEDERTREWFYDNQEDLLTSGYQELKKFFDHSDTIYKEMFREMYQKVSPKVLESVIDTIEKEGFLVPDKVTILETYQAYYESIGRLWTEERGNAR